MEVAILQMSAHMLAKYVNLDTCLELQRMSQVYPAPFGLLLGWGLNDPSRSKGLGGIDLVHARHLRSLRAICGPGDRMPKHVILRGARSKQRTP